MGFLYFVLISLTTLPKWSLASVNSGYLVFNLDNNSSKVIVLLSLTCCFMNEIWLLVILYDV